MALPLEYRKSFSPSTIILGGTSTLTIFVKNPTINPTNSASFFDTYPIGMVNATPSLPTNTMGGILTANNGGNLISLSGGFLGAGATGIVTVQVTVPIGNPLGAYRNEILGALNPDNFATLMVVDALPKKKRRRGAGVFIPNKICVADNGKNNERVPHYGYIYVISGKDGNGNICYIRTNQRG